MKLDEFIKNVSLIGNYMCILDSLLRIRKY